jgi:hypothetical protein
MLAVSAGMALTSCVVWRSNSSQTGKTSASDEISETSQTSQTSQTSETNQSSGTSETGNDSANALPAAYHYNRARSVAAAVDESTTSYQLKASFRDDNNYYYMFYLGRLENVPLQDNVTAVRYDGNDLSYTFTSSKTTAQTVEKCLSTANTNSTSWSHEDNYSNSNTNMTEATFSFSSTQEVDTKVQVGLKGFGSAGTEINIGVTEGYSSGGEMSNTINNGYADVWGGSNAETITDSLATTESYSETVTDSLTVSFNQNYEQGYYRFILLGDVDVFATIVYDVNADEYYYSNIDKVYTKYYALDYSATADFPADSSKLAFTVPDISELEIPEEFYGSMAVTLYSELDDEEQVIYVPYGGVMDLPVLERGGYTFTGWYDEAGKKLTAVTVEKERRLSARWSYKPSQGLAFSLNADGESYAVSGMGDCSDATLAIPLSHNGLPVTSIADNAFKDKQITGLIIPDNITSIGVSAFQNCTALKSIVIGKGVEVINNYAFYNCTALTKIQYNATEAATVGTKECNVAYAGNYIFYCAGYSADGIEVTIGANVKELPLYLFCPTILDETHGPKIVNVKFEEESECKEINATVFERNNFLQEIIIPDSVTMIGDYAFALCKKLQSVTIGKGVETIGNYAFYNCTALTKIQYNATEAATVGTNEGYVAYAGNYIFYCAGYSADGIEVTIGANVKEIPVYLFDPTIKDTSHGPKIISIVFEEGSECTEIRQAAFERNNYLQEIIIPDSVKTIGEYAFNACPNLKSATIGKGVETIGNYAFSNCSNLQYIYCKAESKPNGWSSKWKNDCNATVCWGGSWEYDENGEPKVKS